MTKWLEPSAYFGAVFGAEGEAQPGALSLVVTGRGECVGGIEGSVRAALIASGASAFEGTIEAVQQAQTIDLSMVVGGSGSVLATLHGNFPVASPEFSGRAFWRPVSTPVVFRVPANASVVVQGSGHMSAAIAATASPGMVATGAGSMSSAAIATESVEDTPLEDLALILALAA